MMGKPNISMFSTMNLSSIDTSDVEKNPKFVIGNGLNESNNPSSTSTNDHDNICSSSISNSVVKEEEMPFMATITESSSTYTPFPLQTGNLQLLLQKHVDSSSTSTNILPSAISASSTASVSGGGTALRSRSNTILSDFSFSDMKSRSNTIGSELDLDFVHYALDAWGVAASSTSRNPQQGIAIETMNTNSSNIIPIKYLQEVSTTSTSTIKTEPLPQNNESAKPTTTSSAKQQCPLKNRHVRNNSSDSLQQLLPVLSSSCEDSVSGFLFQNNNGLLSHTPPIRGTSYEASHFGKRMRSGSVSSISGRLRSASDLEDLGIIDRNQRNMLKDLIISNKHNSRADEELQGVLDLYENTGDTSGLQRLISEGRLLQQSDTFDLLDDLDLDFLNVGIGNDGDQHMDDDFERLVDAGTPGLIVDNNNSISSSCSSGDETVNRRSNSTGSAIPDDGVGELDLFDEDHYGGGAVDSFAAAAADRLSSRLGRHNKMVAAAGSLTSLRATTSSLRSRNRGFHPHEARMSRSRSSSGAASVPPTGVVPEMFPKSTPPPYDGIGDIDFNVYNVDDDVVNAISSKSLRFTHSSTVMPLEELQRRRADSIQMFSSLIGSLHSDDGVARETYGQWTNETSVIKSENEDLCSDDSQDSSSEESEADNKSETPTRTKLKRGRKKSEVTIKKEEEAEERRRERIRRREEKERTKLERKAQKETDRLEREENEERMKEEKRNLKESAALAKLEKQMESEQKKAERQREKMAKEKEKEERKMRIKKELEMKEKEKEIKEKVIVVLPPPPPPPPPIKVKSIKDREKEERLREKEKREKDREKREKEKEKREKEKEKREERREEVRREELAELVRKETPSGLGLPRSMSDPNISYRNDEFGLLSVDAPEGWVGAYSPESRKLRIDRFLAKRNHRVWTKTVKYDVRKNFADSRLRVKGRFVKKEDEQLMRDLISLT